jgi:hypothetical protein
MQYRHVAFLCLLAASALPTLAHAQSAASPQTLGMEQGVFDFCSRVDPDGDRSFDRQAKLLWKGMSQDGIEHVRDSQGYKAGYKLMLSVLGELSKSDAVQGCRAIT